MAEKLLELEKHTKVPAAVFFASALGMTLFLGMALWGLNALV